ncbi:phosphatidylinositol glycan anchor biosynthesis class U protein-like isoform X3 [Durio zibethinus]|uniref:Phosphatidylinositol glycan anchor biosynthesis class U protein-like isoform X3 n=1 Tax=Durio zibethinus TaxID=66656 RepID=A0A6P5YWB8_DURZI|nr:phosphatidylinositol glycan anchor biosynthesis class U protein-like isoform X3 [Durio zibethinus]
MEKLKKKTPSFSFWIWVIASIIFRLILIYFPKNLNLSSRPEVSTPLTSFRRLAEGYWLKQSSMSPYAGSMYHGSPLLLSLLGPLTVKRIEGQPDHLLYRTNSLGRFWMGHCNSFVSLSCYSDHSVFSQVIFLLGCGPDAPPRKLFLQRHQQEEVLNQSKLPLGFSWRPIIHFAFWALLWSVYVLVLCGISLKQFGGIWEMFKSTYGFILTVEDLSPNIGVLWYFFAEVFDFFRNFFLIVFHVNIIFMILPLAIRLCHRPCFLAFVYIAIFSMLKSYPSVGDSALYLGLLGWFVNELADMQFSFFLFCGYFGVSLLSPVMHNLWIWRGTGNANFYFATAMVYACLQIILVVEGVSAMLNHDRKLRNLTTGKPRDAKS